MSRPPNPLAMLGTDLTILLVSTTTIWWRLLPRLLTVYLLGYLGAQLALKLAVVVGQWSAWAALVIFSTGFIATLASIVVMLRLAGHQLGVRALVPAEEAETDDRDTSISRLLAITLLPFLGVYTAFGFVAKANQQLLIESLFVSGGVLGTQNSIVGRLRLTDAPAAKIALVAAVIVGCYLLRRGLDALHERTGWRPLGLIVAFVEGFFVLATLVAGADIVHRAVGWVQLRAFSGWISGWISVLTDAIGRAYAAAIALLPDPLVSAFGYLEDHFWPILLEEITQPLIWLAVAALVFGSRVLSVAELWRKGRPLVGRSDRVATRRARRVRVPGPIARAGQQVKEVFLGDVDDKYLPTIHSIRLVIRAGFVFLGAYLLAYAIQAALANYWEQVVDGVVGGRSGEFWMAWNPVFDLIDNVLTEPWRICLLAVAFHRCLQIFRARAEQRAAETPVPVTV